LGDKIHQGHRVPRRGAWCPCVVLPLAALDAQASCSRGRGAFVGLWIGGECGLTSSQMGDEDSCSGILVKIRRLGPAVVRFEGVSGNRLRLGANLGSWICLFSD